MRFKVNNLDLYYQNISMKYYYFYQKYKDHFKIARAKSDKRVLFAVFFLRIKSFLNGNNTKIRLNIINPYLKVEKNFNLSFKKVLENLLLL